MLLLFLPPLRGDASKQPEKKKIPDFLLAGETSPSDARGSFLFAADIETLAACLPCSSSCNHVYIPTKNHSWYRGFSCINEAVLLLLTNHHSLPVGNSEDAKESFSLLFVVAETQFFVYCSRLFEFHAWPGDYISTSDYAKRQHRARLAVRFACYVTRRPRPCNGAFLIS